MSMCVVAPRMESVDRNVNEFDRKKGCSVSLSAWRAWIEISCPHSHIVSHHSVALRMESVDRNFPKYLLVKLCDVAPHTGSVDRNMKFTQ